MNRFVLALLAALASASAAVAVDAAPDPWLTPLSQLSADDVETWKDVDDSRVAFLEPGQDAAALKLLARQRVVALDPAAFAVLQPSTPFPDAPDRKPFLVRAVELLQSTGAIHVLQRGRDLKMEYNGPLEPCKNRHRAVILYLPAPPKHLYVMVRLYS
jgi:hypothetical protein